MRVSSPGAGDLLVRKKDGTTGYLVRAQGPSVSVMLFEPTSYGYEGHRGRRELWRSPGLLLSS